MEVAKQELALPTLEASSCATGCKAISGAVTTKSLRSRRTEGLSDKNFLSEASPCATGYKATSGAVTTKSLRSRRTEGLSDKQFSHGVL